MNLLDKQPLPQFLAPSSFRTKKEAQEKVAESMEEHPTDIEKTLINELKGKGIENNIIPRFIKDLAYSFQIDPCVSLSEGVGRLRFLGWEVGVLVCWPVVGGVIVYVPRGYGARSKSSFDELRMISR